MRFWTPIQLMTLTLSLALCAVPTFGSEPRGFAVYTEGNSDLYVAGFFAPNGASDAGVKRLEIKILADKLSHRRLKRHFIQRTTINSSQQRLKTHAEDLERFLSWFNQPLTRGDHIVLQQKGRQFSLNVNSGEVGTLISTSVFNIMLDAWIGNMPPSVEFKARLLGQQDSNDMRTVFYQLNAEPSRKSMASLMRREAAIAEAKEELDTPSEVVKKAPVRAVSKKIVKPAINRTSPPKVVAKKRVTKKVTPKKVAARKVTPKKVTPKPTPLTKEELAAKEQVIRDNYANTLRTHALKNIRYSNNSRPPRYEDTLRAALVIDRSGKLITFKFIDQSIFSAVNRDIKRSVRRAEPYPLMPAGISGNTFTFDLTIQVRSNR